MTGIWLWVAFNAFVLLLLALDLGIFHRNAHQVSLREAGAWTAVWITIALLFNAGIYHFMGADAGLEFLTGYLIEKSLSVDNIFIFVLLFGYFQVPAKYQHRVLFWGILGALVMRGGMIGAGVLLLERFHWIIYVFGAFLIFTGGRMAFFSKENIEVEANPVIRLLRRVMPVSSDYDGQRFFTRESAGRRTRRAATPLFVVLLMVETTDLIFALDSIPAVFAVTRDPFLVYTSNVFAILGLRALYFLLAGVIHRFHLLKVGLAVILTYVGTKMLISDLVEIPTVVSLAVIGGVLAVSVAASLLFPAVVRSHDPFSPRLEGRPPVGDGSL
jgi:tellurite resistance protein TerC